uniref:Uncharacterized protein n=1 Tax=Arundo donax TaxID=35708 RepID=A0A0A9ELV5_ARUDO
MEATHRPCSVSFLSENCKIYIPIVMYLINKIRITHVLKNNPGTVPTCLGT